LRLHPRTRRTLAALLACVSSCVSLGIARAQTRRGRDDATARSQSTPKQSAPKQDTQKQGAQKRSDADAARKAREVREAVAALREAGLTVERAICVVDREEGGVEALAGETVELRPIFRASDLQNAGKSAAKPHG